MATIKVIDVIDRAEEILQDVSNVRWTQQSLLNYLNDGQREIVVFRPDYKNLSPNTSSISIIERKILDDQIDDWYASLGEEVEHYIYNPVDPKTFYVYPHPAAGSNTIEIIYGSSPANITISNFTSDTTTITLDDVYANALLDYILYRAYQKDSEYAGDLQKSGSFMQSFQNALGIKTQVDAGAAPRPASPSE